MPVQTSTLQPVLRKIGEANSWAVISIQIHTPLAGPLSVEVTVQARKLDADGITQLWVPAPEVVEVTGAQLAGLMAQAYDRAKAAEAAGVSPGQALYVGIRDAVYGSLQATGMIPTAATAAP